MGCLMAMYSLVAPCMHSVPAWVDTRTPVTGIPQDMQQHQTLCFVVAVRRLPWTA